MREALLIFLVVAIVALVTLSLPLVAVGVMGSALYALLFQPAHFWISGPLTALAVFISGGILVLWFGFVNLRY